MFRLRSLNASRIWKGIIITALWLLGVFVPLFFQDPFVLHLFNLVFLGCVWALSWTILARTGYISFAHNAFLGIGAYTSVYLVMQLNVPFWGGFLAAGAMAGIFALILGVIILRLKGIFFVLSTFCFAQIMLRVFRLAVPITGGANGIRGIPPPIFPLIGSIESHGQFYVLFYIYATLVVIFTARLFTSNIGREFKAIGEDMFVAESMGIDTTRQKVIAFLISSVIAGFSGSFHAHYVSFISDTTFEMIKAIETVIYCVVGGIGSIVGPIIGAFVMVPLPEFLRGFVAYQIALYGLILILILRFFPGGIWGTVERVIHFFTPKTPTTKLKSLSLSSELADGFSIDFGDTLDYKKGTILECQAISRHFGGLAALSKVSFSINRGEILGIVGPNGAGKTTLYNVITGVFSPNQGTIIFKGRNITGLRPSKISHLGVGRVFQTRILYTESSVKENVARSFVPRSGFNGIKDLLSLEKKKHQWVNDETQQILTLCGLDPVAEELPKNLPHGFQRLLGFAMALATKPELILLDEPVTGMSIEEMNIIGDMLEKIHKSGLTIIIVEHNVNFVMRLCPRILVLNYGEKIAEGTPEEIRNNPNVIEAFLGG